MVAKMRVSLALSLPSCRPSSPTHAFPRASPTASCPGGMDIWHHVDPDRCGLLPFVFESRLRVSALRGVGARRSHVLRGARRRYHAADGMTFRASWRTASGHEGHVRRLRSPPDHAVPRGAPQAGDRGARRRCGAPRAHLLAARVSGRGCSTTPRPGRRPGRWSRTPELEEREASRWTWLAADSRPTTAGRPVLDWPASWRAIAREGLRRIAHPGRSDPDERSYLEPIAEHLERGASPGEVVLDHWEGDWASARSIA